MEWNCSLHKQFIDGCTTTVCKSLLTIRPLKWFRVYGTELSCSKDTFDVTLGGPSSRVWVWQMIQFLNSWGNIEIP